MTRYAVFSIEYDEIPGVVEVTSSEGPASEPRG